MKINEVLRHWQAGGSQRAIARSTGLSRTTICRSIRVDEQAGLRQDGPFPTEEQLTGLAPLNLAGTSQVTIPTEAALEPWADQIHAWLTGDRLLLTRIQELLAQRGCLVSFTSLRRFVSRHGWRRRSQRTVRMADTRP